MLIFFFAAENTEIHGKITNGNHEEISECFFFVLEFFRVFRNRQVSLI